MNDWSVGDVLLAMFIFFLFILWIWVLIDVLTDLFRREDAGGWYKGLWVVGIIVFPLLGVLIYLILRGGEMHKESLRDAKVAAVEEERHHRQAESSAAHEIATAKQLLDSGAISQEEFDHLKDRALR